MRRRTLLLAGLAGTGVTAIGACIRRSPPALVRPDGEEVRTAEAARHPGPIREFHLTAMAGPVDLGGLTVATWSYGGQIPGPPIRVKAGEVVRATLANQLPEHTTVHWHGIAIRNDADGVPKVTQQPIDPGAAYTYQFTAPTAGTYWLHPHAGVQLDRGLYAPLIVDDPHEPLQYDDEWIVVLDDWLDGVAGRNPEAELAELRRRMGGSMMGGMMGGHTMGAGSSYLLGGDAGDVSYPHYLLNGRISSAPAVHVAKPGQRIRLRLINAGGDTAFRVALGGHRLQITHTDGSPVQPVETDALLIGMGERYDAVVTLDDGVFPLVALAEGKNATARGLIRTSAAAQLPPEIRPAELDRRIVAYSDLAPGEGARVAPRHADRTIELRLTGGMMSYEWGFNGRRYDPRDVVGVRAGERVRLNFVNATSMWHPVHLHGHTFATGPTGLRKDTAIVLPGQTLSAGFDADNPGIWMVHCHNIYHAEAGMMTLLGYLK